MVHNALKHRRDTAVGFCQPIRLFLEDGAHRLDRGIALESPLTGKHFIEHDTKGKNVGAMIRHFAPHLLRSHVTGGTQHDARMGVHMHRVRLRIGAKLSQRIGQLCDAKVQDLDLPVVGYE